MASVKIASLFIKTVSKPIANKLKQQAAEHERFRKVCISLAQFMHSSEVQLRTNLMGESRASIRPLNDAKAVANGANSLAEGFLFLVGISLIIGEAYRSSRNAGKRRDDVDDRLDTLLAGLEDVRARLDAEERGEQLARREAEEKIEHLSSILSQVISIGLKGGWLDQSTLPPSNAYPTLSSSPPPSSTQSTATASAEQSDTSSSILPFIQLQSVFQKGPIYQARRIDEEEWTDTLDQPPPVEQEVA